MGKTQTLLYIVLVLLVLLYIQSYLKPKTEYTIIQTYLDKISIDTVYDKYPIIIYDLIQDPKSLLKSLFAYSYQFDTSGKLVPNKIFKAAAKFTLIYNDVSNSVINIISPKFHVDLSKPLKEQDSSVQYVTVNLKQHQVLILPLKWYIETPSNTAPSFIMLDDFMSATLRAINII